MANRFTSTEEDYWGLAMGVLWDGHSYLQSVNKKTSSVYNLLLQPNGGSVGVGTTSPLQRLHVSGNGQNPVIYMTDPTNNRYASGMGTHNVTNVGQRLDFYNGDSGANGTSLSSSHIRMSINASGNVGIGTTSPACPLHVNATASASVGDTHTWIAVVNKSGGTAWNGKFGGHVSNQSYDYSIKASGAVGSTRFIIKSDERIKKDIVDVEDDEALVKLRMLHPKNTGSSTNPHEVRIKSMVSLRMR